MCGLAKAKQSSVLQINGDYGIGPSAQQKKKKKKKKKTHEKLLRLIWSVIWDLNKNQQANSVDLKRKKNYQVSTPTRLREWTACYVIITEPQPVACIRKWQDYVYIQCEYKSTKQKIKHLLRDLLHCNDLLHFFRLEDYERNFNFGQVAFDPQAASYRMQVPDAKTYRDVTSSTMLPKVTEASVDIYLSPVDGCLSSGQKLYDATYVW